MILSGLPDRLPQICDASLVKTECAYKAYKDYPNIAEFYHGVNAKGKVFALISKIDGYVNLWAQEEHRQELCEFLRFLSPMGIFTDTHTADYLNLKIKEECLVFKTLPPYESIFNNENKQPRELLNILRQGLSIPDGDGFVADVTFRVLHGCAHFVTENNSGGLLFTGDNNAIINGIAVARDNRGKGQGSRIVKLLLSRAQNKNVYACCTEKNKGFYLKNGFSLIGKAAYCEGK